MVLVCLVHLFLSWLGRLLEVPLFNEHISLIWPAAGFAIAVVWRFGFSFTLPIAVSIIFSTLLQNGLLANGVGIALGTVLGIALAVRCFAMKKLRFQLDSGRDLIWFLILSLGVGTLISALNGATQLWLSGDITDAVWALTLFGWWFGDSLGVLVFGIPLLCFQRSHWQFFSDWRFWLVICLSALSALLVFWSPAVFSLSPTLLFLPLLPLLWSALRQGLWAASVNVALISSLAIIGTINDRGVFAVLESTEFLVSMSSYVLILSLFSYLLVFLHQSGARTRDHINSALQGSGLGIWQFDLQKDQVQLYGQAEMMLGYQPGELGQNFASWLELVHPDDIDLVRSALRQHLKGESPLYQVELRLLHKQRHWIWVLSQGRVIEWDAKGLASQMVGSNTDISALKQADSAVSQLKDFYATVLSKVVTGVWVCDIRHRLVYVNLGLSLERIASGVVIIVTGKQIGRAHV